MNNHPKCPFFGRCGGCAYDFTSPSYRESKASLLTEIPSTSAPIWVAPGVRRRGDFCFSGNQFGFFESHTKNIIPLDNCPNLVPEINRILPSVSKLPWAGSGSCLITSCENGIDIAINSTVPYVTSEFRSATSGVGAIRVTWNGRLVVETATPIIKFGDTSVEYPSGAFLQPSISGADALRELVTSRASGFNRIADLFCGLGNFTFALNADGFDIVGTGVTRDLFKKPLTLGMLAGYDCVVMDPPRAGARAQCDVLAQSNVRRVIYVSCNPGTFMRDLSILQNGGYVLQELIPVDQFVGSHHWELFATFDKK
ncbi:MAG: class I SAM-dependent RNA methyltransferase [Alphaproteobacteria bacterium]|nr:class I SAM-dependent RNA methyltransferase [Alphaproteobacteria bacterium]